MSAWQPINSVPVDGSAILVSYRLFGYETGQQGVALARYNLSNAMTRGGLVCCEMRVPLSYATHWMPLPEAPQ